jgi:hypothetical protein
MPGPYIHMSAARRAAAELADGYRPPGSDRIDPEWHGTQVTDLAAIAGEHPNFTAMGAMGPDLFFFLPDFRDVGDIQLSSVLVRILEFLEGVYEALDPYISKYEKYLGPIVEDTAEELSRLTGGLSESVGNITGELGSILTTALANLVTQQRDWWSFFSLGLNKGYDEQSFFWSDMLHYRQTGEFGQRLWAGALVAEDRQLQAYALGYLSHLATDTVGHAFVNQVAGGPFRLHWQRHHLVENHADAYWYLLDPDPGSPRQTGGYDQLTESALYYDIAFAEDDNGVVSRPALPGGNTLRDKWVRRRLLDIDSELPEEVAELLIDAMTEAFYGEGGKHPKILRDNDGRPNTPLVQEAYRLFWRYLKIATVDGFGHEPPPPPDLFPNLDFPTPSDPAEDGPPGDDDGGDFWDDLLDFILAVVNVLAYIVEVAVYLATLPWAILADIITYPFRLALYYALELPLYYLLKTFRSVLVRTGYVLPMADEIDQSLIRVGNPLRAGWEALVIDLNDIFGGLTEPPDDEDEAEPLRDPAYPYVHDDDEFRHPWRYPTPATPTERCPTTAGPHGRNAGPPALFRAQAPSADIRDRLETARTPAEADRVGCAVGPGNQLGDVVNMTKYLMWLATRNQDGGEGEGGQAPVPLTDWNLDADRGYGYHCWDWNRRSDSEEFPPVADPERNDFLQPCTWPSQTSGHDYDPAVPLQLHWAGPGLKDRGCQDPECIDCAPVIG